MCTIGSVFDGRFVRTFKQCDLTQPTQFLEPELCEGKAGRYLAMRRVGRKGVWAATNEQGVSFVAADSYTRTEHRILAANTAAHANSDVDALFEAYERSIGDHLDAPSAIAYLSDFYMGRLPQSPQPFDGPDIALISDLTQAIYLEYSPIGDPNTGGPAVRTLSAGADFFASTNHFRMFTNAVDYADNHSTYLRLARAEALLTRSPTLEGLERVLSDQYYGQTELSICRVAERPGEYYTQATVIFSASPGELVCQYLLNGNLRTKRFSTVPNNFCPREALRRRQAGVKSSM